MIDKHHILFPRQEWTLRPEAKALRNTQSLIPAIDREDHNEIHSQVPFVPVMGYYALRRVMSDFYPQRTTLGTLDELMFSMDNAQKLSKHPLEKSQIELSKRAIEMERDILRQILGKEEAA